MGLASNATGRLHISVLSKIKQVNWTPKHNQGKIYTLYSMIALWSKAEKKHFLMEKRIFFRLGKTSIEKNVLFQALPESPNPPPPDPNLGNLALFFRKSKFNLKVSLELKIL